MQGLVCGRYDVIQQPVSWVNIKTVAVCDHHWAVSLNVIYPRKPILYSSRRCIVDFMTINEQKTTDAFLKAATK